MNSSSSQSALPRARNESAIDLFSPYRLGELELANRIVMAPMTRSRAVAGNVPTHWRSPITRSARAPA
jgi:NADH:flavin oxidoreductases, Old Yellow Enzyme family